MIPTVSIRIRILTTLRLAHLKAVPLLCWNFVSEVASTLFA